MIDGAIFDRLLVVTVVKVRFASLGTPNWECGSEASEIEVGCHVSGTREVVEGSCLGKRRCRVETEGMVTPAGEACGGAGVRLVAEAVCAVAR